MGKQRRHALQNLKSVFGDRLSARRRRGIARRAFQSVTATALESVHASRWSEAYFRNAVEFYGDHHWQTVYARGQGLIFVTAHFGNWELTPAAFLYHTGITVGVIMRDIRNEVITAAVRRLRERRGIPVYSTTDSALAYIKRLKSGGIVALLGDQDSKHLRSVHVPFFGRPSQTAVGAAYLARKTGAEIVPAYIHRRADDPTRHRFRCHRAIARDPSLPEDEDIARMLEACNRSLEKEIRENPEQWAWMHRRWRH